MATFDANHLSIEAAIAKVSSSVLQQDLDGEGVLLDLDTGHYFGLDAVGAKIWRLLQQHGGHCARVIESMLEEFDVGHDRAGDDLARFLNQLQAAKLVTVVPAGE